MARRTCLLCGEPFDCFASTGFFLCPKCYREHYLPRKEYMTLSQFRTNIDSIREEIRQQEKEFWKSCGMDLDDES